MWKPVTLHRKQMWSVMIQVYTSWKARYSYLWIIESRMLGHGWKSSNVIYVSLSSRMWYFVSMMDIISIVISFFMLFSGDLRYQMSKFCYFAVCLYDMYQYTHSCIHRVCNSQLQFWWSGRGIRYTWSTSNDWLSVRHTLRFLHISGQTSHEIDFKFGECIHYETPLAWLTFCHAALNVWLTLTLIEPFSGGLASADALSPDEYSLHANFTSFLHFLVSWDLRCQSSKVCYFFTSVRLFIQDVMADFRLAPSQWETALQSHRWIPLTKASDAELWWYLWPASEQTIEYTIKTPSCPLCRHCNGMNS